MKKAIMALGYVFLVMVVVLIIGAGALAITGSRLDKQSKAFVDAAVPAIASAWDLNELQKRASPEFEDVVDYDDLEQYFGMLRQLGKLVDYKGSTGDANITLSFQYGYEITADYSAVAEFEAGSTDILISLIRHDKQWQILDLKIDPRPFMDRQDII